ncbi:MAG: hypothetical protein ACRDD8_14820 [Bacteroidales bacterium]
MNLTSIKESLKLKLGLMQYTSEHWVAYQVTAYRLQVWSPRHLLHDVDKLFMYPFFSKEKVTRIHRLHNKHHVKHQAVGSIRLSDVVDAIVDWECARITKPDKPLNARDTLYKFYPQHSEQFEPILKFLKL